MDGSVLEEKSSFKMLGLTFSSKLDLGSCSYAHAWNTAVMSRLMLLRATWNCI